MKVSEHLKITLPKSILEAYDDDKSKHEVIWIAQDDIKSVSQILKTELSYDILIDIVAIDWQDQKKERFEIDYLFYATKDNARVLLKIALTNNEKPTIDSIADIYPIANWCERECFDMMGYHFRGHPNLKRLLMWEEFEGHPLRKDYPIDRRQPIPVLEEIV